MDGLSPTRQETSAELGWHPAGLLVRFFASATNPWATQGQRDAPLWEENVVEIFLAAGPTTPRHYREVQVNPLGAVFDALVETPNGNRDGWSVDAGWDWPGLRAEVILEPGRWSTELWLPWVGLGVDTAPSMLRANLFRIDRDDPGVAPDHGCWSAPNTDPADFHRPASFGLLVLEGLGDTGSEPWPAVLPALLVPRLNALPAFVA